MFCPWRWLPRKWPCYVFPASRSAVSTGLIQEKDWSFFWWTRASYKPSCAVVSKTSNVLAYSEGKRAITYDRARQSSALDDQVLIPLLGNHFGLHYFKLAILGDCVLGPVILQLFRMLLEISLLESPTNPYIVLLIYNDGNEVWRISVRSGVPVLPLYLFCALWGEMVDVSDESLIACVEEEGDNSYRGGLVQSLLDENHLAQPLALSRCLIKGFFLPFTWRVRVWGPKVLQKEAWWIRCLVSGVTF